LPLNFKGLTDCEYETLYVQSRKHFDQRIAVPVMTVQEIAQRDNYRWNVKIYLNVLLCP